MPCFAAAHPNTKAQEGLLPCAVVNVNKSECCIDDMLGVGTTVCLMIKRRSRVLSAGRAFYLAKNYKNHIRSICHTKATSSDFWAFH